MQDLWQPTTRATRPFRLKPDVVLMRPHGQVRFILDAKWKRIDPNAPNHGVSQADAYQLFAYGRDTAAGASFWSIRGRRRFKRRSGSDSSMIRSGAGLFPVRRGRSGENRWRDDAGSVALTAVARLTCPTRPGCFRERLLGECLRQVQRSSRLDGPAHRAYSKPSSTLPIPGKSASSRSPASAGWMTSVVTPVSRSRRARGETRGRGNSLASHAMTSSGWPRTLPAGAGQPLLAVDEKPRRAARPSRARARSSPARRGSRRCEWRCRPRTTPA